MSDFALSDVGWQCSNPECGEFLSNGYAVCPYCNPTTPLLIHNAPQKPKRRKTKPKPHEPKSLGKTGFKLDIPTVRFGVQIEYVRWYKASREKEKEYNAFYYDGHWHSIFELWFYVAWQNTGYPMPTPEHAFATTAGYRFDFAWQELLIAVELEGGVYSRGRHTRGSGYKRDLEKYNEATALGWRVYRFADQKQAHIEFMKARFDEAITERIAA